MASFFDGLPQRRRAACNGFSGNRIDRRSEKRDDGAVADRARRSRGAALPVPGRQGGAQGRQRADPIFTPAEAEAPSRRPRRDHPPRLDRDGPRLAVDAARRRRRSTRAPYRLIDLRSLAVEGSVTAEHLGAMAQARSLCHWHLRHGFCARLRRADRDEDRRLPPRLPGLRRRAFPAHRPGGDHARRSTATAPFSAGRPASRRACIRASPASSSRARRSRTPSAARRRRRPASASAASATTRASPGRSRPR